MYINGRWLETGDVVDVYNPATGALAYSVQNGTAEHVQEAIAIADETFKTWSNTTALERANYLLAIAEKMEEIRQYLAEVITKEMGKPIRDARGEVQSAIDYFRWFAEESRRIYGETVPASATDKRILVIKQPIGVVGAITPWNFPLSMIARKVAPALAAGCTMVLKPSSKAPQSAIELTRIMNEVGLPAGVFNLVMAPSSVVTDELMMSKAIKKITFTGSTRIGKMLLKKAANTVKRVSMELGGHAPFIVFDDADLDEATTDLIATKFRCSGQMCTATNRIFVQSGVLEEFTAKLTEKVMALHVGNGLDEDTSVGPVIDSNAVSKLTEQIEDAKAKGANLLVKEVNLSDDLAASNFIAPTILTNVTKEMDIFTEESFGPVAPIIAFDTEEELLEVVNHEEYGLAAYLYSTNLTRVIRVSEAVEYGMVGVNDPMPFVVQSPFGGVKESGIGKEGGHQGIEGYLEEKMISIKF